MKVIATEELEELILTGKSKRYKDVARSVELLSGLRRAINAMKGAHDVAELSSFSYLHYEKLKYEYTGLSSVRLSNRYVHRLLFEEKEDQITLRLIEIDDTHYGNK